MGSSCNTIWERTHHTDTKVLKAVCDGIQYGSDDMDAVVFVYLLVCLVFVSKRHGTTVYPSATCNELHTELCR